MEKNRLNNKAQGKPFVKWVGGKTQLLPFIEKKLPADFSRCRHLTYVEPFVGGGAVLFWILQKYSSIQKAVINDINPDLMMVYRIIKEQPKELIDSLQSIQSEYLPLPDEKRKEYYLSKRECFNLKGLNEIDNSALFIFLNRTCFNGLFRVNSKGLFNVPFGKYVNPKICDEQTIWADSELLQKVEILTGNFEKTLLYADKNAL